MASSSANNRVQFSQNPSFFDFFAQEALNDLLNPAFKRISAFLWTKYPEYGAIFRRPEETFLCMTTLVQYHYLKHFGKFK